VVVDLLSSVNGLSHPRIAVVPVEDVDVSYDYIDLPRKQIDILVILQSDFAIAGIAPG